MAPDFQKLSEKIIQLSEITQQLRLENADLRLRTAALVADNSDLTQRMREAAIRVSSLIEKFPSTLTLQEEDTEEDAS